jgi:uncharacterized SAM-binding protein YcdF (DUF218 family)
MSVRRWARVIWDYHHVGHALAPADAIVVLGSHDTRVAERGAELFLAGWAPLVVLSGHLGSLTSKRWTRPEAEIFADVAAGMGVPRDRMLIEARSTNTGENVSFCRALLAERGIATFRTLWPELDVIVTSPQMDFDAYPNAHITQDDVIHIMVGDFQRLMLYAKKGWSATQEIPDEVMDAYQDLVAAGYTGRLLPEE